MDWHQQQQLAKKAALEAERIRHFVKVLSYAPVDPFDTAIKCGCDVRFVSLPSVEGIYSPEPKPAILIGSDRPAGRRSFTCAHELGHHIFKHGARVEELNTQKQTCQRSPEEFMADVFAGLFLMSQISVSRALKDRGWLASTLQPEQAYRLANFFGVGYGTIVNHFAYSLKIITIEHAENLLKIKPKQIKDQYGADAKSEVVLVDHNWLHRAVDLESGDTLVLPENTEVDFGQQLRLSEIKNGYAIYKAASAGLSRAFCSKIEWAVNVRVSRKNYEGLARFRFLEDEESE
jgi:Zn-dependent peptidase ImmA (M78 family)